MPESKTTTGADRGRSITDDELVKRIKASYLADRQKTELAGLVSEMTAEERSQLLGLIDEANKVAKERDEKIAALNKEYEQKLGEATREESEYVREEFEKFDKEQSKGEFEAVEAEIAAMPSSKTKAERVKMAEKKKHTLRNVMLAVIGLAVVIGIILITLNSL